MCPDLRQEVPINDPVGLLKQCDNDSLEKLYQSLRTHEHNVSYDNHPKRALVKCVKAREKYEWHTTQAAQIEKLTQQWEQLEKKRKAGAIHRRISMASYKSLPLNDTGGIERSIKRASEFFPESPMLQYQETVINSIIKDNEKLEMDKATDQSSIKPEMDLADRNKNLRMESPLLEDDEILKEALQVAEKFEDNGETKLHTNPTTSPRITKKTNLSTSKSLKDINDIKSMKTRNMEVCFGSLLDEPIKNTSMMSEPTNGLKKTINVRRDSSSTATVTVKKAPNSPMKSRRKSLGLLKSPFSSSRNKKILASKDKVSSTSSLEEAIQAVNQKKSASFGKGGSTSNGSIGYSKGSSINRTIKMLTSYGRRGSLSSSTK